MVFKNFYIQVAIRVMLIILTSLFFAWLIMSGQNWLFILHTFLLLVIEGWLLVRYTNRWNNDLSSYFERLQAGDLMVVASGLEDFPRLKGMNSMLTKLKKTIGEERRKHELENEYFKVLSSNIASGIMVTDKENRIKFINPAALQLFDISSLHHLGHLERNHPGSFSIVGGMKTGDIGRLTIRGKSGNKHLIIRLKKLIKDDIEYKVFSLEDIEKAIRTNEVQSWQKLIRVLNHEIMNSISPINSTVQTLSDLWKNKDTKPDDTLVSKTIKGLRIIHERGEGLKEFVSAYKNLTSNLTPQKHLADIHNVINNVHELYKQELASKNIQFEFVADKESCEINTDADLLSQALINILKNAIEAFSTDSPDPKISISINRFEDKLCLLVLDNGKGMDEETLKNASIPFFTTKENGSGVGLSLSRQIINALDGEINIISQSGIGTKVEILL